MKAELVHRASLRFGLCIISFSTFISSVSRGQAQVKAKIEEELESQEKGTLLLLLQWFQSRWHRPQDVL